MPRDAHPFDSVLEEFPGVRRVTEQDIRARRASHGPLPIVTLMLVGSRGAGLARPCLRDYSVRFVGDKVQVVPSVQMELESNAPRMLGLGVGTDNTVPPYAIGIRRCRCRNDEGGRLWNPLVVGLLDEAITPELREILPMRWLQCVRTRQSEFCAGGIEVLKKLELI